MLLRHVSQRVPPMHVEVYIDVCQIVVASDGAGQGPSTLYEGYNSDSGWWPSEGGKEV